MARTTTEHQIVVQAAMLDGVLRRENIGTTTLYPGYLVELASTGHLQVHGIAGGVSEKLVVLENQTPATNTYPLVSALLQPYQDEDTIYYCRAMPGDILQVRLATSQTVVKGVTWLQSNGAGHVTACGTGHGLAGGTSNLVGLAWENIENSGSAALCKVLF